MGQLKDITLSQNVISATETGINLFQNTKVRKLKVDDNIVSIRDTDVSGFTNATGIRADENAMIAGTGLWDAYSIESNTVTMANGKRGISFSNAFLAQVKENTVSFTTTAVNRSTGIEISGTSLFRASCNSVTGNSQGNLTRGIHFTNARCNESGNFQFGFNFSGMNTNTFFAGNQIGAADDGLLVGTGNSVGGSSFMGEQPFRGNLWTGTYGNSPAYYELSDPAFADAVQFKIDNSSSNQQYADQHPTGVYPPNWFIDQNPNGQTTFTCTQSTCPTGIGDNDIIDNVDTKIATDSLPTGYCSDAIHWTGGRQLYSRLMANPSLINVNADLQNFMNSASQNSIGAFYNIEQQIGVLFTLDSTDQAQLDTNRTELATKTHQLLSVMEQLATDAQNSQLLASRDQLSQDINALHQQNDGLLATFDGDKANAISGVRTANLAISATQLYEQNQQRINDIFLQTIASDIYDFTPAQDSVILSIADQCVICGGDGVLLARSMYASVDPKKVFSDDLLCASSGGQQLRKPNPENEGGGFSFTLFPNPASQYVLLKFDEEVYLNGEIKITDTFGKLLKKQVLDTNGFNEVIVITDDLRAGAYILSLYVNGKIVQSEKLMILK